MIGGVVQSGQNSGLLTRLSGVRIPLPSLAYKVITMTPNFLSVALQDVTDLLGQIRVLSSGSYTEETKLSIWRGFLLRLGGYNMDNEEE